MSVYGIAREFFSFLRKERSVSVSGVVLGLMKLTSGFLLASSVLSTAKQFFGDPIYCDTKEVSVDKNLFEHFCWIQASFVAPRKFLNNSRLRHESPEEDRVYQNYYQWIPFILFFQGILCYAPYAYWKSAENGRVESYLKILEEEKGPEGDANEGEDVSQSIVTLAKRLAVKRGSHCGYALQYLLSLLLSLVSLATQLYLMDLMMGGNFLSLGTKILYLQTDNDFKDFDKNPLLRVFPRLIRCWFEGKMGMSGSPERYAALCILPVNVFNEKIFVFIWFWFIILITLSLAHSVWTVLLVACSLPRLFILRYSADPSKASYASDRLARMSDFGDWFLLRMIQKNIDGVSFKMLVEELAEQVCEKPFRNFDYPSISPLSRKRGRRDENLDILSLSGRISRV